METEWFRWLWLSGALVVQGCSLSSPPNRAVPVANLSVLLACSAQDLEKVDIARMNLLCAEGLPGCAQVELDRSLEQLDEWAARVKSETARQQYRFERKPAEFENSKGFYKLLVLGTVLAEDFKVHYRQDRQAGPETTSIHDGFFADARDVFLPGLLNQSRHGTCSSMPVLYVAVGRRLGYPLKLVTTKGHLFVRWEGEGERFNLEVTGNGVNRFPDEYYRRWPFTVSELEVKSEAYLQSLSPTGELAVFLSVRAMCLREAGQMKEAAVAFAYAAKLAPEVRSYQLMEAECRKTDKPGRLGHRTSGGSQ